jgi:hypothetical protein
MRHDAAAFLLKCVAVIYFGFGCQQMVFAIPAGTATLAISDPPQARSKPVLIAAISPEGSASDGLAGQEYARPDSPATPQMALQEIMSTPRPLSVKHRRRKPKMASVPNGYQTVAQVPELPAQQAVALISKHLPQPAAANEADKSGASVALPVMAQKTEAASAPGAFAQRYVAVPKINVAQESKQKKYGLAPIHWGARLEEILIWRRTYNRRKTIYQYVPGSPVPTVTYASYGASAPMLSNIQSAKIGAETFILKPWIATVFGSLGVISSSQGYVGLGKTRENRLFGEARLSAFALSRFPFYFDYIVNDSRNNDGSYSADSDLLEKKLTLSQTYTPLKRDSLFSLEYNRNDTTNRYLFGDNTDRLTTATISGWKASYSTLASEEHKQPYSVSASHRSSERFYGVGYASSSRDSFTARNAYMPENSLLSLRNSANYFRSSQSDGRISTNLKLGTTGSWQPEDEDNPLILRGGAQLFYAKNEFGGSTNDLKSLNANITATYPAWTKTSVTGGAAVAAVKSNGVSNLSTTEFGRVSYSLDAIKFGNNVTLTRNLNAGFTNTTATHSIPNLTVYAGGNHALIAPYSASFKLFGVDNRIDAVVAQSATATANRRGASETLTHRGSVIWSPNVTKKLPKVRMSSDKGDKLKTSLNVRGYGSLLEKVSMVAQDTRIFGYSPSHSQSLNLSAVFDSHALLDSKAFASISEYGGSIDVNMQAKREINGNITGNVTGIAKWAFRYDYNYSYKKAKAFNVPGMDYSLTFNANINPQLASQRSLSYQSQLGGRDVQYYPWGVQLIQNLRYRIGQNEALLTGAWKNEYGIKSASLFFRFKAWRNFGN